MSQKVTSYLKKLSESPASERADLVELIKLKNYGSNELSENEMWILATAAKNQSYLDQKLQEKIALDPEAPSEVEEEELSLDAPAEGGEEELSLDAPAEGGEEELSLDAPAEEVPAEGGDEELSLDAPADAAPAEGGDEELSLDAPAEGGEEELSLDAPAEAPATEEVPAELETTETDDAEEAEPEIETSLAGVGILPLLAEIQEKLANGKPSEVELAALKAMKKLF